MLCKGDCLGELRKAGISASFIWGRGFCIGVVCFTGGWRGSLSWVCSCGFRSLVSGGLSLRKPMSFARDSCRFGPPLLGKGTEGKSVFRVAEDSGNFIGEGGSGTLAA